MLPSSIVKSIDMSLRMASVTSATFLCNSLYNLRSLEVLDSYKRTLVSFLETATQTSTVRTATSASAISTITVAGSTTASVATTTDSSSQLSHPVSSAVLSSSHFRSRNLSPISKTRPKETSSPLTKVSKAAFLRFTHFKRRPTKFLFSFRCLGREFS